MKKTLNRFVSAVLAVIMIFGIYPALPVQAETAENYVPIVEQNYVATSGQNFVIADNGYIKFYVNKITGGFYILPSDQAFDETKAPSFGSFKINGEEYIFGGDYPNSSFIMPPTINHGGTCQTVWQINDIYIYQYLNIIKNDEGNNSYAVYIKYEAESAYGADEFEIELEGRILIDTIIGADDNLPISLPGDLNFITNETSIVGENIPIYYGVSDIFNDAAPLVYGLLIDETVTTPLTLTFASFENVENTVFDYNCDESYDFTGDSAVLLYFDGEIDNANGSVSFSTIYGFSELNESVEVVSASNIMSLNNMTTLNGTDGYDVFLTVGEGFELVDVSEITTGEPIQIELTPSDIDYEGYGTYGIESISLKDSQGNDISYTYDGELFSGIIVYPCITIYFTMPSDDVTLIVNTMSLQRKVTFDGNSIFVIAGKHVDIPTYQLEHDQHGNPIWEIKSISLKDSQNNAILYEGGWDLVSFTMPLDDVTLIINIAEIHYDYGCMYCDGSNCDGCEYGCGCPCDQNYRAYVDVTVGNGFNAEGFSGDFAVGETVNIYILPSEFDEENNPKWAIESITVDSSPYKYVLDSSFGTTINVDVPLNGTTVVVNTVSLERDFKATIGEGYETDDIYPIPFVAGRNVEILVHADEITFGESGNPIPIYAIEGIALKDSQGKDIPYTCGGSFDPTVSIIYFTMPLDDVTLEITTVEARKISLSPTAQNDVDNSDFEFVFADGLNNHGNLFIPEEAVFAAGNKVTMYLTQLGNKIPNNVSIIGKSTSQSYTVTEIESYLTTYAYEFIMPDEDIIVDFATTVDLNHKFKIIPSVSANMGALAFNGNSLESDDDSYYEVLPNEEITINISGIDYINCDFHGVYVRNYYNNNTYQLNEIISGEVYTFTMPSADVYVALDVRQKPSYSVVADYDNADVLVELKNERSGVRGYNDLTGYAGDKITFNVTNINIKKIVKSIQLSNAGNNSVLQAFTVTDKYADYYSGEFYIPASGSPSVGTNVVLKVEYENAPSIPVVVEGLPSGTVITPSSAQAFFGDTVSFDFKTSDTRYIIYRPVLKSYDANNKLLYEEYYQNDTILTSSQTVSFSSETVRKTGGVPAKIVLTVYEQHFEYKKQMTSIVPNSTKSELFTEINIYGINMFEHDDGVVYIGTSSNPTREAVIKSSSENMMAIYVPADMLPTDYDVTYYVKINGVEKSCVVTVDRLARKTPFGFLAVVSDKANRHSIIVADSESELINLKGSGTIILKLMGDVSYNHTTETYDYNSGSVLFNDLATYKVILHPLRVKKVTNAIEITAVGGTMSVPGFTFVTGENIAINLIDNVKYNTAAFLEKTGNALIKYEEENIVIEYKTLTSMANTVHKLTGGMVAEFKNVHLLKQSIVFGGLVQLSLKGDIKKKPSNIFKIEAKRIQFGLEGTNFVFQGIEASGEINFGTFEEGLIGGFKAEENIKVSINTFKGEYIFSTKMNYMLIKINGELKLATLNNGELAIDAMKIIIPLQPGIPILPGLPIGDITSGGIGFEGRAKTLDNDYSSVPPFRINLYGSLKLIKLFELKDIKISIGLDSTTFSADPRVTIFKDLKIFEKFEGGIYYTNGIQFKANTKLVLVKNFEVFTAEGIIDLSYSSSKKFSFSGSLSAKIQVPKIQIASIWVLPYWVFTGKWYEPWKGYWAGNYWTPINIGPYTLAERIIQVNDTGVSYSFSIVGYNLVAKYNWGASLPTISTRALIANSTLETTQSLYDQQGEYIGYASFASNLSIAARSDASSMMLRGIITSPTISTNEEQTIHTITFPYNVAETADEYAVLITSPKNDINVTSPTGQPFILKYAELTNEDANTEDDLNRAGVNAVIVSTDKAVDEYGNEITVTDDEGNEFVPEISTIMIRLPKEAGDWSISSSIPFASVVLNIAPIPEINSVEFDGNDKVSYSVNNLDLDKEVYMLEVRMSTDDGRDKANIEPGMLIDEIIIDSGVADGSISGEYTIERKLIKDFESGEYYPRLVLLAVPRDEYISAGNAVTDEVSKLPRDSKNAITSLTHTNANEPAPISGVTVSPGGGGALKAVWQKADNKADGYIVNVYGENNNPIYMETDVYDENGDVIDTQWTPISYNITNEHGENGSFDVNLGGLTPGNKYQIEVIPYADIKFIIDEEEYSSIIKGKPTLSNIAELPVPDFPVINAALPNSGSSTDGLGNRNVYVNGSFSFGISSNQECKYTVYQNDEVLYSSLDYEQSIPVSVDMTDLTTSAIQIVATNKKGDTSYFNFVVYIDDIAPVLLLITDEDNSLLANQTGQYIVMGYSEPGANVYDDLGNTTEADINGEFYLTGNLPSGANDTLRSITAVDSAGNTETADIIIKSFAGIADSIEKIELVPSATVLMSEGERFLLSVRGVKSDNTTIKIPSNAVSYNILGNSQIAIKQDTGYVTAINQGTANVVVTLIDNETALTSNLLPIIITAADAPAPEYEITVVAGTGGRIINGISGKYSPSDRIWLEAAADSGYMFAGWTTSSGSGDFVDENSVSTEFIVVAADTTITANFKLAETGGGVKVSGTISSYNPKNETTIELFDRVTSVNHLNGATVVYTSTIEAEASGSGQTSQRFDLSNVAVAEYTLRVKKDGHLSFIKLTLTVGEQDIDLDDILDGAITLVPGDINGDGQIDSIDLTKLISEYGKSGSSIGDSLADINGDGQVDSIDLTLLISGYGKSNTVTP